MELQFDVSEESKKKEDVVLAPLEPNIEIRTMKSDIQALKESGGYLTNISGESVPPVAPRAAVVLNKPIFVENQNPKAYNLPAIKIIIIIIGVLILAAAVGFGSYYLASEVFK
ncbi:MAG: hypothetical protein AAB405_02220 [Patescibacteria group bacterium]